ncbi:hypothetical protein FNV43_RR21440 [Rhamnella rubrinervis]|uniref:Uncharacterized protein n=1 Tax=Rhamnella rubrinervis TaxID=2594499 RepID=A0A8K0E1P0_9ROSA|nr:hypothetical protein FNV43_RR21440 [Rhamnella rubrinervis]
MCVFSEDHEAPSSASSGSSSSASKALGFSLTSTVDSLDMVNAFEVVPKSKKSAPSVWKLMALVDLLLKQAINNARERDRRTLLRTVLFVFCLSLTCSARPLLLLILAFMEVSLFRVVLLRIVSHPW